MTHLSFSPDGETIHFGTSTFLAEFDFLSYIEDNQTFDTWNDKKDEYISIITLNKNDTYTLNNTGIVYSQDSKILYKNN